MPPRPTERILRALPGSLPLFSLAALLLLSSNTPAESVICDGEAVRALSGCTGFGDCVVKLDVTCDASCGEECRYEFPMSETPILRGTFQSTGPAMAFVGNSVWVLGPGGTGVGGSGKGTALTFVPGIETVEGGYIGFDVDILWITRPIRAPGGTIDMITGGIRSASSAYTSRAAQLDVSSRVAGGTIRFRSDGFMQISLFARGLGPDAPGGRVVMESRSVITLNYKSAVHRIDVSGGSGGTVELGPVQFVGSILANGRNGDGGTIVLDAAALNHKIVLGSCIDRTKAKIRVDGKERGGSFTALVDDGEAIEICQTITASGGKGGGTVIMEGESIEFRRITARSRRASGGTVRITAKQSANGEIGDVTGRRDRIDVRGAPGGHVEIRGDGGTSVTEVLADATKPDAGAGTVYVGELNDPPTGTGTISANVRKRISARSRRGAGGIVTLRACRVAIGGVHSPVDLRVGGGTTGGQVLLQSRGEILLPDKIDAVGPGASIRVEYATNLYRRGGQFSPDLAIVQYPSPDCDCTKTWAECMTPP